MPIPDTQGVPPFAEFDDLKRKINELVQKYNNLLVNLDSLNVVSLTADHVDTGTLDANVVTIAAEDGSYSYTLDGTGIKANNGVVDTFKFDLATGLLTIVSALIQSSTGFPKVELNSANTLISAFQNANNYLDISPTSGGSPGIGWTSAGSPSGAILSAASLMTIISGNLAQLLLQSGSNMTVRSTSGNINLDPNGSLQINGTAGSTDVFYVSSTNGGPTDKQVIFSKGIKIV